MKRRFFFFVLLMASLSLGSGCIGPRIKDIRKAKGLYSIGVKQTNLGQYRQALASLTRAEKLHPKNYWIQEALGGVFMRLGRPQDAHKHYKRALDVESKSPRGWNNLGASYMAMGKWKKAIKAFDKALANVLYQTPCHTRINIAWAHHKIKEHVKAKKLFQTATKTCPRLCQGYRMSGIASFETKQFKPAERAFFELTRRCKKYAAGYYWLAQSRLSQKKLHDALPALRTCVKKSAPNSDLQNKCNTMLAKTRQTLASRPF